MPVDDRDQNPTMNGPEWPNWPDRMEMIRELRRAVGLFDGAMSISPKQAWEQAIERVRLNKPELPSAHQVIVNYIRARQNMPIATSVEETADEILAALTSEGYEVTSAAQRDSSVSDV